MVKNMELTSNDGVHKLHVVIWQPEENIRAVMQISHGMIEFIERYDGFARYLNEQGIVVIGNDHLGHGHTAGSDEDLGYFCPDRKSETVVKDLHTVTEYARKEYPGIPYFLFGHSMGSFMARRYLMTYGNELTGAILCGTGEQTKIMLLAGKLTAGVLGTFRGQRYRSEFIRKSSFKGYNDRFKPTRTENDWLTKDTDIVDWYNCHKFCTFGFTINGYKTLFEVLTFIQKKENYNKIPKDLPVYMIAGADDPVGNYGEGVKHIYQQYKDSGIKDISMKLYPDDRHEILNELDKETVYADVTKWLTAHME